MIREMRRVKIRITPNPTKPISKKPCEADLKARYFVPDYRKSHPFRSQIPGDPPGSCPSVRSGAANPLPQGHSVPLQAEAAKTWQAKGKMPIER
jgi:hypothetical protein